MGGGFSTQPRACEFSGPRAGARPEDQGGCKDSNSFMLQDLPCQRLGKGEGGASEHSILLLPFHSTVRLPTWVRLLGMKT